MFPGMPTDHPALARRLVLAGALALMPAAGRAAAQAPARADSAPRTDPLCWRGRPLPRCRAFMLFEVGYHARAFGTRSTARVGDPSSGLVAESNPDVETQVTWTLGAMRNRDGGRTAVGGGILFGEAVGQGGSVLGAQARVRRWLGRAASAEVAAGPVRLDAPVPRQAGGAEFWGRERAWGVAVDSRLTYGDQVGVGVRAVALPGGGRMRGGVLAGGNVGSGLALGTTVALAAIVALAISALSDDY
jgi:hypothetical protein